MNNKKTILFCILFQVSMLLCSCSKSEYNYEQVDYKDLSYSGLKSEYNYEQVDYKDLSYGALSAQELDMLYPTLPSKIENPVNVVLFIHGGGWSQGDKSIYKPYLEFYAKNFNVLSVSMNYRMFGDGANCSDMLEDIHLAIKFIKEEAANKQVKVNKIMLYGASAGAHLALLYSYKNHSISQIPIAFCVSQSAPVDFTDLNLYKKELTWWNMEESVSKLTGKAIKKEQIESLGNFPLLEEAILSVSPINYIKTGIPPTLFAHGKFDDIVPFSNALLLCNKLKGTDGVLYDFIEYSYTGHDLDQTTEIETQHIYNSKLMEYIWIYLIN